MRCRDGQRILKELRRARKDNNDEFAFRADEENIRNWSAVIKAPAETPYENFYYKIQISIPEDYPIEPPTAKFITPIFHPNIHFKRGDICLNILKTEWTPAWGIQTLCTAIQSLLAEPAPDSPLNTLAANLLKCGDNVGYRSMGKLYAKKFAFTKNIFMEEEKNQQNESKK